MNADRRKMIDAAISKIEEARADLETCRDEEQEYLDNMPEAFQQGERGQQAEAAISSLEDAINSAEEAESNARSAIGG